MFIYRKYQKHEYNYLLSSEEEKKEDINCNTRIKRVPMYNDSFTFKHKILIPKMYHNNPSSTCFSKQIDLVWKESYNDVQYSRSSKTICMEFVDDDEFIYITKLSLTLFKHKELTAINRIIFITSSTRIVSWFGRFLAWRFQVPSAMLLICIVLITMEQLTTGKSRNSMAVFSSLTSTLFNGIKLNCPCIILLIAIVRIYLLLI
ncbi:hypothetical protein KQX54_016702 [Cotesia glomerata]|uniref:Uncharacterized protein n=1 Tax=Cotesia glomerata TaxID=32391 RepID=A0AAV7I9Z8_COTGL|nr:hypothetical protein KQX54_016702 [Cotesia glomerata]